MMVSVLVLFHAAFEPNCRVGAATPCWQISASYQRCNNLGASKMFCLTAVLSPTVLSAIAIRVQVKIKPSSACGNVHTRSDYRLIIDYISIFHLTNSKKKILSAAISFVSKTLREEILLDVEYLSHNLRIKGDVLKYDSKGKYHLILNVRANEISSENGIFYWYTRKVMNWQDSRRTYINYDESLFHKSPFLPGEIKVHVNGNLVINRNDDSKRCFNAYAWIPDHGIYLLK
ncbi:hypothetical protein RB195_011752 [Necator americanus]|uniref:Uncharacterized protein n=1 Tax=Necator americanus TaxID=51031 RepID=A0ABR1D3U5_NECAM